MLRKTFFSDESTHPYALGKACENIFGLDFLNWEAKTVYAGIKEKKYEEISETNANKLNAYRTARATILPWVDWNTFELVVNAFNGIIVNFESNIPCKIHHLMSGVDTLRLIQQVPFSDEIKRYIASCGKYSEIDYLPDPLTFCMKYLCRPMYRCLDCGHKNYDDLIDDRCDFCCGRYERGILVDSPAPGLENRGTNIQRYNEYDYYTIANKFDSLKNLSKGNILLGVSYEEIQIAKLLDFDLYRKSMKNQLNENIQELKEGGFRDV